MKNLFFWCVGVKKRGEEEEKRGMWPVYLSLGGTEKLLVVAWLLLLLGFFNGSEIQIGCTGRSC